MVDGALTGAHFVAVEIKDGQYALGIALVLFSSTAPHRILMMNGHLTDNHFSDAFEEQNSQQIRANAEAFRRVSLGVSCATELIHLEDLAGHFDPLVSEIAKRILKGLQKANDGAPPAATPAPAAMLQ